MRFAALDERIRGLRDGRFVLTRTLVPELAATSKSVDELQVRAAAIGTR